MTAVLRLLQTHPQSKTAFQITEKLHKAGHRVLFAGGCVRDALLGIQAQDLDIATSAKPDDIAQLFDKTVDVGKAFGVMRVILDGGDFEVATFRKDGESKDGRHPDAVVYSDEREDALRRDFTVNALFFDPFKDEVLDYVDGQKDLAAKILKTVGSPEQRFAEDHLRILRAVRFAVQLGFEIEPTTWSAVQTHADKVKTVSRERIRDELAKLLKQPMASLGPKLLEDSKLLEQVLPALAVYKETLRGGFFLKASSANAEEAFVRYLMPVVLNKGFKWDDITQSLDSLKLSKSQMRFALNALECAAFSDKFWAQTLGQQLIAYTEPACRFGMTLKDLFAVEPRHQLLQSQWMKVTKDGALPARLVTGSDLIDTLKGSELGLWLERVFEGQLEGRFTEKAQALEWIRSQLKLGKSLRQ